MSKKKSKGKKITAAQKKEASLKQKIAHLKSALAFATQRADRVDKLKDELADFFNIGELVGFAVDDILDRIYDLENTVECIDDYITDAVREAVDDRFVLKTQPDEK